MPVLPMACWSGRSIATGTCYRFTQRHGRNWIIIMTSEGETDSTTLKETTRGDDFVELKLRS